MTQTGSFLDNEKVKEIISSMLESSFYLEMKLAERLKLIKMLAENYSLSSFFK